METRSPRDARMWAITSYFDPSGRGYRLENYRTFRRALGVPLLSVELAFDGAFALRPDDADILIQTGDGDVLWQKERLLNVALSHLPAECEEVVWVDCDLVFEDPGWMREVRRQLARFPLVQAFERVCDLGPGSPLGGPSRTIYSESPGVGLCVATGTLPDGCFARAGGRGGGKIALGLAWAARRELLDRHGLYDLCIIGSGDRALASAALGRAGETTSALWMNEARARHYLTWADEFFNDVAGRVGHVRGRVLHLWHGDFTGRRSGDRHRLFHRFDFDPNADVRLSATGCWRWSSPKAEMHAFLIEYFQGLCPGD